MGEELIGHPSTALGEIVKNYMTQTHLNVKYIYIWMKIPLNHFSLYLTME